MTEAQETTGFESEVAAWLQDHPDFFTRHPALVETLHIPHPCQPAASLLAYQNRLLRERCQRQHDKLLEFVSIARDNGRLADRVQRLALRLLNGRSRMAEFLRGVEAILRDEFKADDVALCLAGALTIRPKIAAEFLCPEVVARFGGLFLAGQPRCGRLRPEQAVALFGNNAPSVASAALIPSATGTGAVCWRWAAATPSVFTPAWAPCFWSGLANWSVRPCKRGCRLAGCGWWAIRHRRATFNCKPQPFIQSLMRFSHPEPGQGREQLGAGWWVVGPQGFLHLLPHCHRCPRLSLSALVSRICTANPRAAHQPSSC